MTDQLDQARVYLDYAAATPLLPAAKAAMEPYWRDDFGNPSAIHAEGRAAQAAVTTARAQVARAVEVKPELVTFTGGGTEGNNLALFGLIAALAEGGVPRPEIEIISTPLEHPSLQEALAQLAKQGIPVRYAPVDGTGRIQVGELAKLLTPRTRLVATALVNSEIGTIQPVRSLARVLRAAEARHGTTVYLHLDAAQAPLWCNCQLAALRADLVVFDAAKCHGPKGVGALVRSKRVPLAPVLRGGGQEAGLRPGTENVPGIVGAGVAFADAQAHWQERANRVRAVRDAALTRLRTAIPEAVINGPEGEDRVANNINISLPGLDTEFAAVVLDTHGFAVSTKSACSGAGGGESTVVRAISGDAARAASTLRLTLGPDTTTADLDRLTQVLQTHIEKQQPDR